MDINHLLRKKKTKTPTIPPEVVERNVCMKLRPMLNDKAGAKRNLMLLTAKMNNIFKNPDKAKMFPCITLRNGECCN